MMRVRRRTWRTLLIAVVIGSPLGTWGQSGSGDLDELYTLFSVALPPADVVLLMDASGSMLGKYDAARAAAVQFANTLTEKEHLHLRVFAGVVGAPLDALGSEARQRIEGYLPPAPLPGRGTDLGIAIQKGLEFLERPGSASVQIFLLITDGLHQPPANSPYSRDFQGDKDWLALRERAQNLCQQHTVLVYGFGIGNQTDIQLLQQLFPAQNVELVVGNVSEIANFLLQIRERIRRVQIGEAIQNDLERGQLHISFQPARVQGSSSNFTVIATIRNTYRLPVIIERIIVHSAMKIPLNWDHKMSLPHELPAEKSLRVELHGAFLMTARGFQLGKERRYYRADYRVVPEAHFKHGAILAQLQRGEVRPRASATILPIELSIRRGIAWETLICAFIAMMSAILVWRTLPFNIEQLTLRLNLTDWPTGAAPHQTEWILNAGSIKTFGTGENDEQLPQLRPGHITVDFKADGTVSVRDINTGAIPLEDPHRMFNFRVGDYAFNGRIERQEWWHWKPIFFAAIALVAIITAIAFQVYT